MSIEDDLTLDDEYDEEADSDFEADVVRDEGASATSDDEDIENDNKAGKTQAKHSHSDKVTAHKDDSLELDSGDEATIKEQKKARRKQKRKGEEVDDESGNETTEWRARTRAMREHDRDEKRRNKLANIQGSTIDVDKIWEEMNRPGPLMPINIGNISPSSLPPPPQAQSMEVDSNKENTTVVPDVEEMITIKRKYKFAGEVHIEEKAIPKSSAEARLWLAQQVSKPPASETDSVTNQDATATTATQTQRPLRKISRFDPNYNNLNAFKVTFSRVPGTLTSAAGTDAFKGPKLNVVEKSKMDWASHVDAEGLKDELDEHAKAKEGYHSRMEFLGQVELRKEEEARIARSIG